MMRPVMPFFIAVALVLVSACGGNDHHQDHDRPLQVVASFSLLEEWVGLVGGDRVQVVGIAGRGVDPHAYEPTPQDAQAIEAADLVLLVGHGFEGGIETLIRADEGPSNDQDQDHEHGHPVFGGRVVSVAAYMDLVPWQGEAGDPDHHHAVDPHFWQDPDRVLDAIAAIRDALIQIDPAYEHGYRTRALAYQRQVEELQAWIEEQVATLPEERRLLVTNHDALAYYAQRYGFTMVGTVLGGVSTEVADPSAQAVAGLVEEIKRLEVPAIFAEAMASSRLATVVAEEAGVTLVEDIATDALGPVGSPTGTYLDLMRHNTRRIVEALAR